MCTLEGRCDVVAAEKPGGSLTCTSLSKLGRPVISVNGLIEKYNRTPTIHGVCVEVSMQCK